MTAWHAAWRSAASRPSRGQSVLEFMLVLPFFFAFLLMVVDLGIWMSAQVAVGNAAREGARFAAVHCARSSGCTDGSDIKIRVRDRSGHIVDTTSEVKVWWRDLDLTSPGGLNAGKPGRGDSFVVRVTHPHRFLFIPSWSQPVTITACAEMILDSDDLGYAQPKNVDTDGSPVTPLICP